MVAIQGKGSEGTANPSRFSQSQQHQQQHTVNSQCAPALINAAQIVWPGPVPDGRPIPPGQNAGRPLLDLLEMWGNPDNNWMWRPSDNPNNRQVQTIACMLILPRCLATFSCTAEQWCTITLTIPYTSICSGLGRFKCAHSGQTP